VTVLDANVVLRYLLDDIPQQSQEATQIIENGVVFIPHEVFAEVVYVLTGVYSVERPDIVLALKRLLAYRTVRTSDRQVVVKAIERFESSNLDFVDCLLLGYAAKGSKVVTFDKGLRRKIEALGDTKS